MIRKTYPDRICYRPGCDVHECRVLLPEGIWMELLRIVMRAPCHQGEGSLHLAHADGPPCDTRQSSFHPGRNSVRPTFHFLRIFHIRRLTPDGRGGPFNFPSQTCPDPLIAFTRLDTHNCGVLLKLPDICDRHFWIFCFRFLMSKSPFSPCNPPIIGFLSY